MRDLKALFLKKYANLPLGAREEIITVVDGEPLTWRAVRIEVEEDTEKAEKILGMLRRMEIL